MIRKRYAYIKNLSETQHVPLPLQRVQKTATTPDMFGLLRFAVYLNTLLNPADVPSGSKGMHIKLSHCLLFLSLNHISIFSFPKMARSLRMVCPTVKSKFA
jgi:hypothetical protein